MMRLATPDDAELIHQIMRDEDAAKVRRGIPVGSGPMEARLIRKNLASSWVGVIEDEARAFMLCRRDEDEYRIPYMLPSTMGLALGTGLIELLTRTLIGRDNQRTLRIGGHFETELSARAYQGLVEGTYERTDGGHFVSQQVGIVNDKTRALLGSIDPSIERDG